MTRLAVALLGFAAAAVLSALWTKSQVVAVAGPGTATGWDSVVEILADPYFITLPILPALVVRGAITAPSTGAIEVLIRHGSRSRSAVDTAATQMLQAVPFFVVWIVIAVSVAAPLGFTDGWSDWARSNRAESFAVGEVATRLDPLMAAGAQMLLLLTGAWAICVGIGVLAAWTGRGRLMLWSCAGFLVWASVSFRLPWNVPEWAQPISYLTVQHAVADNRTLWIPIIISLLASVAILGLSTLVERGAGARVRFGSVGVFSGVAAGLLVIVEVLRSPFTAGADSLAVVFYGLSEDRFDLISAMLCLVLTLGPALVLQMSLTERLQRGLYEELIRSRTFVHWWWRVHLRWTALAALTVPVVALCVHFMSVSALHGVTTSSAIPLEDVLYFVVFTAAQIAVSAVLLAAATLVTGRIVSSLWVLGVMVAASLPVVFQFTVLPIGMNSLSLPYGGVPSWHPALVLAIWAISALFVTFAIMRRRGVLLE